MPSPTVGVALTFPAVVSSHLVTMLLTLAGDRLDSSGWSWSSPIPCPALGQAGVPAPGALALTTLAPATRAPATRAPAARAPAARAPAARASGARAACE